MYSLEEVRNHKIFSDKINNLITLKRRVESNEDRNVTIFALTIYSVVVAMPLMGLFINHFYIGFPLYIFSIYMSLMLKYVSNRDYLKQLGLKTKYLSIKSTLFLNKNELKQFQAELDEKPYFKKVINKLVRLHYSRVDSSFMLLRDRIKDLTVEELNNELEELELLIEKLLPEKKVNILYEMINKKLELNVEGKESKKSIKKEIKKSIFKINSI
jgi:hypothetical protein